LIEGTVEQFAPEVYGLDDVRSIASPSWSPDGTRLSWWVVTGDPGASQTSLALFDLGEGLGSGSYTLLHPYQPVGGGGYNPAPVWSPNSRWMAATVLSEGSKAAMWVFSTDGGEINLGDVAYPVWSADGAVLIVTQWPSDGGPAWESTAVLFLEGEWIPNLMDLNLGSIPIAFR
jgi:Tol biopolymer transport system component